MRARLLLLGLSLAIGASACSPIEPWVKPYERENIADPIMAFNRDPISTTSMKCAKRRAVPRAARAAAAAATNPYAFDLTTCKPPTHASRHSP
mgnify:CR=1 FL=1